MREDVLALPDHLRDALWKIESARLQKADSAGLFVCGMGGSAIGGDLAAAALGERLTRPLVVVRGYSLPSWAQSDWAVLCSSFSGNTEETNSCWEEATELGTHRMAASTGGRLAESAREAGVPVVGLPGLLQPRAAVGYMFAVAAEAASLIGAGPNLRSEIESAADGLTSARASLEELAREIAAGLEGRLPVIYGAGPTIAAARRWQCEINENAKLPAISSELPEANHNEIEGWTGGSDTAAALTAVFLGDADQHPREELRIGLMGQTIERAGLPVIEVQSGGETPTERLLYTVMLGDLVSVELAERRGVDPEPVEALEGFKRELGQG